MPPDEEYSNDNARLLIEEQMGSRLQIITWAMGGIMLVLLAGIPWAFSVHGHISSIQTKIESLQIPPDYFKRQVDYNTEILRQQERRLNTLEALLEVRGEE